MMAGRREEEIQTSSSLSELSDQSPVAPDVSDVEEERIHPDNSTTVSSSSQASSDAADDNELVAPREASPSTAVLQRRQSAPAQEVPCTTTAQELPKAAQPATNSKGRTPLPTSRPKATSGRGALPTGRTTRASGRTAPPVGGVSKPATPRVAKPTRRQVQILNHAARPAADRAVPTPGRATTYTGRRLLPNGRTALPTAPTPSFMVRLRYTPGRLRLVDGQLQRVALDESTQVPGGRQQPPSSTTISSQAAVPTTDSVDSVAEAAATTPPPAPRPAIAVLATGAVPVSAAEAAAALPPVLPSTPVAHDNLQTQPRPDDQDKQHWAYKRVLDAGAVCDTCFRTLGEVMSATHRGDGANIARLSRVIQQCLACGRRTCRACFDADRRHAQHPLHRMSLNWSAPASPASSADGRGGQVGTGSDESAPSSQNRPSEAVIADLPRGHSADDGPCVGGGTVTATAAESASVAAGASDLRDLEIPACVSPARPNSQGLPPTVTLDSSYVNQLEATLEPQDPLPVSGNNGNDNDKGKGKAKGKQVISPPEPSIPDTESPPTPPRLRRSARNRRPPQINPGPSRWDPYEVPSSPLRDPPKLKPKAHQQKLTTQPSAESPRETPQYRFAQGPDLLQPPQTEAQRRDTLADDVRHFEQRCATTHAQQQLAFLQEEPLHERPPLDLRGPGPFQNFSPTDASRPSIFNDLGAGWTHGSDQEMVRAYNDWIAPQWTPRTSLAVREPTDPRSMGQPLLEGLHEARNRANQLYRELEEDPQTWNSDLPDLVRARDSVRRLDTMWRSRVDLAAERAERGLLAALSTVQGAWDLEVLAESPFVLEISRAWLEGMGAVFSHYYPEREDDD